VELLPDALARVRKDYFRPLSSTWLDAQALRGAIAALHDPYSNYYDHASWQQFTRAFSGASGFAGIGVALAANRRGLRITRVFPHSPAGRSQIKPGQLILAANGQPLEGLPTELAVAKLAGRVGTSVSLTIVDGRKTRTVRLVRAHVPDPSVTTRMLSFHGARVLDIRVDRFAVGTSTLVLRALMRAARSKCRGAILDLRGNIGGLVSEAITLASALLPKDATIVSLHARTGAQRTYLAAGDSTVAHLPLVELVDHNTISAGEIFTAALKDNHRALIIGQHTFGKGVFQELIPLPNGGGIELTIGEYFTPSGRNLGGGGTREGGGITPNVAVRGDSLPPALRALTRRSAGSVG
jgi:carboxyl-terminal processing protease